MFGVFLFVGAYMLGLLRAHKPRLWVQTQAGAPGRPLTCSTLASIFGTIIMDCAFALDSDLCGRS